MGSKGGGGGSSVPSSQTVTQTNLPAYAQPYFEDLLNRTQATSQEGYVPYGGARVAGFEPMQEQAFQGIQNNQGVWQGDQAQAEQGTARVAGMANPQYFTQGAAQFYMNPYQQNVSDIAARETNRQGGINQANIQSSAAMQHAFGGDRQAIMEAENQRNVTQKVGDIYATGQANAYQNAQSQFNADRTGNLQTGQLGLAAAQQSGNLAAQRSQLGYQDAGQLANAGLLQQQQKQQALDTAYSDFVNQRDFGRNQENFYSGILRGVPVNPQSDVTQYAPPPSQYAQALGAGIAGIGAYKASQ